MTAANGWASRWSRSSESVSSRRGSALSVSTPCRALRFHYSPTIARTFAPTSPESVKCSCARATFLRTVSGSLFHGHAFHDPAIRCSLDHSGLDRCLPRRVSWNTITRGRRRAPSLQGAHGLRAQRELRRSGHNRIPQEPHSRRKEQYGRPTHTTLAAPRPHVRRSQGTTAAAPLVRDRCRHPPRPGRL